MLTNDDLIFMCPYLTWLSLILNVLKTRFLLRCYLTFVFLFVCLQIGPRYTDGEAAIEKYFNPRTPATHHCIATTLKQPDQDDIKSSQRMSSK